MAVWWLVVILFQPNSPARKVVTALANASLRPRQQTHRHAKILGVGEPARSGAKIARHKFIADLSRSRSHALEAKVAH